MNIKHKPPTDAELAAIEAVKTAVRALPRGIYISIEWHDSSLNFFKQATPWLAAKVGKSLISKRKVK